MKGGYSEAAFCGEEAGGVEREERGGSKERESRISRELKGSGKEWRDGKALIGGRRHRSRK